MPGYKAKQTKTPLALQNIDNIMKERESNELIQKPAVPEKLKDYGNSSISEGEKLYSKNFLKVGKSLRRRYEQGQLPIIHKLLLNEIIQAMHGTKKAKVTIYPILEKLQMPRSTQIMIFSCLEEYGILKFSRAIGDGRAIVVEILQSGNGSYIAINYTGYNM